MKKITLFLLCSGACLVNASVQKEAKTKIEAATTGAVSLSSAAATAASSMLSQTLNLGDSSSSSSSLRPVVAAQAVQLQKSRYLISPANTHNEARHERLIGELLIRPKTGTVYFHNYLDEVDVHADNSVAENNTIYSSTNKDASAEKTFTKILHDYRAFITQLRADNKRYYKEKAKERKAKEINFTGSFQAPLKKSRRYWVYEQNGKFSLKQSWHFLYVPIKGYLNSSIRFPKLKRSTSHPNLSNPVQSPVAASSSNSSSSSASISS